jgi:hypothetical protein
VRIYNNQNKEREIFRMRADRIIDFSARYNFFQSGSDAPLGSIKKKGLRSLWRTTFFLDNPAGQTTHHLKEDNPWTKVGDALFGEIPILGIFGGYVFNPAYTVYRGENREDESQPVMHLKKQPAFFESSYTIELAKPDISNDEEIRVLLGIVMAVQLERRRG